MKLVAGLVHNMYDLERAMLELKSAGFSSAEIQWVDLHREHSAQEPKGILGFLRTGGFLGDTQYRADNASLMDGTTAGATVFALLGIVYGSVWRMGPITGATIGVLVGGLIGWLLDQLIRERRSRGSRSQQLAAYGCLVLVNCHDDARVVHAQSALRNAQAVLTGVTQG